MEEVEAIRADLRENGQEHLLVHLDRLEGSEREELYKDIEAVNLKKLAECFRKASSSLSSSGAFEDARLKPLDRSIVGSTARDKEDVQRWMKLGLEKVAEGQVAVLLLAGGQGTRLGVNYPKGMYNVGLPSGKTLYQLQAERILKLQKMAKEKLGKEAVIPWYIMTSDYTKEPTQKFFEDHRYFGLEKENVILFEQFTLPCMDLEGRILLADRHKLARAPDGNGGLYTALASPRNSVLQDMAERGIGYIHVYCVDNILVRMADPVFIGFCEEKGAECGAKVVQKLLPTEKVGVVCKCDDHYQVVEYSEISANIAGMRESDGSLTFKAGNICNHFFTLDFLRKVCRDHEGDLVHHIAKKKITHMDQSGNIVSPNSPNAIKMEKFVFDVFQFARHFAVLEVLREDEFSPLKNGPGADKDTPTTARNALMDLHYRQLLAAGVSIVDTSGKKLPLMLRRDSEMQDPDDSAGLTDGSYPICEISPLVSYAGEDLETYRSQPFRLPIHITNGIPHLTNSIS